MKKTFEVVDMFLGNAVPVNTAKALTLAVMGA
jgi:hypothetical protein